MYKAVIIAFLAVLIFSFTVFSGGDLSGKKIYIDPGHGGSDSGAVGFNGLKEADVNLKVATNLKDLLVQWGNATVQMSRTSDATVSLSTRVQKANTWGAERFISIHHNASVNRRLNGTETYSHIFSSSASRDLRNKVQVQLLGWGGLPDWGAKSEDFYVLKNTHMPAILTEASFISNPDEESRLRDSSYTWRQAYYIYRGIADHYGINY